MLTIQIDNADIESIFTEVFQSNKEKFFEFIKQAYIQKDTKDTFELEKERLIKSYQNIKNGSMKMYSQDEAELELDRFLDSL